MLFILSRRIYVESISGTCYFTNIKIDYSRPETLCRSERNGRLLYDLSALYHSRSKKSTLKPRFLYNKYVKNNYAENTVELRADNVYCKWIFVGVSHKNNAAAVGMRDIMRLIYLRDSGGIVCPAGAGVSQ